MFSAVVIIESLNSLQYSISINLILSKRLHLFPNCPAASVKSFPRTPSKLPSSEPCVRPGPHAQRRCSTERRERARTPFLVVVAQSIVVAVVSSNLPWKTRAPHGPLSLMVCSPVRSPPPEGPLAGTTFTVRPRKPARSRCRNGTRPRAGHVTEQVNTPRPRFRVRIMSRAPPRPRTTPPLPCSAVAARSPSWAARAPTCGTLPD